jgi:hypothetical protein
MTPKELADQMYNKARAAAAKNCNENDIADIMAFTTGWLSSDLVEVLELLPKSKFNELVKRHKLLA